MAGRMCSGETADSETEYTRDFPGGDVSSIPDRGTKIPRAAGQLSPRTTTTELKRLKERACRPQTTEPTCPGAHAPQLERENPHAATREKSARHNKRSHMPQLRPDAAKKIIN